jgi:UDP-glucose 4-epimerase
MNLLVTGGAGFIGSHLLALLKDRTEIKTVVFDNLSTGFASYVPAGMELIRGDIRGPELQDVFAQGHFDAVVHLAAQTMVPYSMEHPAEDCDINLKGVINVLEGCRKYGVKSIAFSSSAAVYGDNLNVPLQETEKLAPTSFYGITKMATEHYLRVYNEVHGLNATVFRFANVYGERQGAGGEGGVVSIYCKLLTQNKKFQVFGTGKQTRDFVYAGDIAAAILASFKLTGYHVINVSTAKETSINELISYFIQAAGHQVEIEYLPPRQGDIFRSILANDNLKQYLGLEPQMTLAEGIKRTYAWYLKAEGGLA